jgi:hypothetical protein
MKLNFYQSDQVGLDGSMKEQIANVRTEKWGQFVSELSRCSLGTLC